MTRKEYDSYSTKYLRNNFYFCLYDCITDYILCTFDSIDELADYLNTTPNRISARFRSNQKYQYYTFISYQRYLIKAFRK